MSKSLISVGKQVDELSYFKELIGSLRAKAMEVPYAERRSFEIINQNRRGSAIDDLDDAHLEKELQMAMEQVGNKEKDFA